MGMTRSRKEDKNSDVFTLPPLLHYSEQLCTDF